MKFYYHPDYYMNRLRIKRPQRHSIYMVAYNIRIYICTHMKIYIIFIIEIKRKY